MKNFNANDFDRDTDQSQLIQDGIKQIVTD